MCAGTPGVDIFTEGGGPKEDHGIVPGHAYSIIQAKEYKNIRLLNVRNPWGEFEWGGAWSDNDSHWTDEMIQAFNPSFDSDDGAFWMSYEDFFMNFDSLTICKTQNWNELRLKGKFIRVQESQNPSNDWVISQFYYSFHLDKRTHIEIGLHQEDQRILGAERRPYLDLSLVILKRSEADGTLSIAGIADNETDRDLESIFTLDPGHYIVVPRTIGAMLKAQLKPADPIKIKVSAEGTQTINQKAYSALNDLFRKIDLQLDGILTSRELNLFGKIINDKFFQGLTPESFKSKEFEGISCTEDGLTRFGMFQIINQFSEQKIQGILSKMGYDECLFSTKSRVFVITFHSSEEIRVRIGNASKTNLNEKAITLILDDYLKNHGAERGREDRNVIVFRKYHDKAYGNSFGAVNKTDRTVEVNIDITPSENCAFTPKSGRSKIIIPPKSLKYLGASCK